MWSVVTVPPGEVATVVKYAGDAEGHQPPPPEREPGQGEPEPCRSVMEPHAEDVDARPPGVTDDADHSRSSALIASARSTKVQRIGQSP